jgi:hypothetical protein
MLEKNERGNSEWYKEENYAICHLLLLFWSMANSWLINDYINLKGIFKFFLQLKITPIKYQGMMIVVEKYSSFFTTWYFLYM